MHILVLCLSVVLMAETIRAQNPCDSQCTGRSCFTTFKNATDFECYCDNRHMGDNCDGAPLPDACNSDKCGNGEKCASLGWQPGPYGPLFGCDCASGPRYGPCDVVPDPCDPDPCLNEGACSAASGAAGGFECACPIGFEGNKCEHTELVELITATTVQTGESAHFSYELSGSCKTLKTSVSSGSVKLYYAVGYQPTSASNDGVIEIDPSSPSYIASYLTSGTVYLTLEATDTASVTFELVPYSCDCPSDQQAEPFATNFFKCIDKIVPPSGAGYNCGASSPCSPLETPGKYHYPHTNPNKFVQCSAWGGCWEMPCAATLVWNDAIRACTY